MKKNKKSPMLVIAIASIIVLILAVSGFAFNMVKNSPKAKVLKGFAGVSNQLTNTFNDFMPNVKPADMFKNFAKNGNFNMEAQFSTGQVPFLVKSSFGLKQDAKNKKIEMSLDTKSGSTSIISGKTYISGNDFYIELPVIYDKPLKMNLSNIGRNFKKSPLMEYIKENEPGYEDEFKPFENLRIDLFKQPFTLDEFKDAYLKEVGPDLKDLKKNMRVKKIDLEKSARDSLKKLDDSPLGNANIKEYVVQVNGKYLIPFADKFMDFSIQVLKNKFGDAFINKFIKDEGLADDIDEYKKEVREALKENSMFKFNVFMENDKLRGIRIYYDRNNIEDIFFLGKKNTTDFMAHNTIEDGEISSGSINFYRESNINKIKIREDYDEEAVVLAEYDSSSSKLKFIDDDDYINVELKNVKPGVSFEIKPQKSEDDELVFKKFILSTERPKFDEIKESVDLFQLDQDKMEDILMDIIYSFKNSKLASLIFSIF